MGIARKALAVLFVALVLIGGVFAQSVREVVHGREPGQASQDAEGLQTMRTLARNMAFLMKSIALGKEKYGLPSKEAWQPTHFIR